jgi:CheY-like chemotaxis protein
MLVMGDHTRTKQILMNLMSNAIKYNQSEGLVTVSCHKSANRMVRFEIKDTGNGIAEDKQHELFKPFSRLGAEMSDIQGSGIGLSVCKTLVELMGGEIGFNSKTGVGSTFWFELPQGESKLGTTVNSALEAIPQTPKNIPVIKASLLYVEDNLSNIHLMQAICESIEGLELIVEKTAERGLEIAESRALDIIIFDINLPGLSGIDAVKRIRQNPKTAHIPAIGLSASAMLADIEEGLSAGFNRYLTKPIDVQDLFDALVEIVKSKER